MKRQSTGNFSHVVRNLLIGGGIIWFISICASGAGSSTSTSIKVVPTHQPTQVENSSVLYAAPPTKVPVRLRACVDQETIRIRKGPGTQYEMIGGLVSGTCMNVLGRNQDASWVYIVADDSKEGWVAAWFLTVDGNIYDVPVKDALVVLPTYTAEVVMPKENQNSGNVSSGGSGSNSAGGNSSGGSSSSGGVSTGGGSGPTALCNDGTYSYSAHRQGTCSHHGGVAQWLK